MLKTVRHVLQSEVASGRYSLVRMESDIEHVPASITRSRGLVPGIAHAAAPDADGEGFDSGRERRQERRGATGRLVPAQRAGGEQAPALGREDLEPEVQP